MQRGLLYNADVTKGLENFHTTCSSLIPWFWICILYSEEIIARLLLDVAMNYKLY